MSEELTVTDPAPLWKEVWALKIKSVEKHQDGSACIEPVDSAFGTFEVSAEYMKTHNPQPGRIYVAFKYA